MTSVWIWNGESMPRLASTAHTASDTPSERKSVSCLNSFGRRDPVSEAGDAISRERGPSRSVMNQGSRRDGRSCGRAPSTSRSRCSSWATRSSSSSQSSRVTRPSSRTSSRSALARALAHPERVAAPARASRRRAATRTSSTRGPTSASRRSSGSRSGGAVTGRVHAAACFGAGAAARACVGVVDRRRRSRCATPDSTAPAGTSGVAVSSSSSPCSDSPSNLSPATTLGRRADPCGVRTRARAPSDS